MRKVAVFHPGTQHSWQTARALQELGRLAFFATTILYQPDRFPYYLEKLPGPLGRRLGYEFGRFRASGLDPALVRTGGAHEWFERAATRAGFPRLARRIDQAGNRAFGRMVARAIEADDELDLWGYDQCSRTAFELGRARGRRCILDRTIGHPRTMNRILGAVREEAPEWFGPGSDPMPDSMIASAEAELTLADLVLAGSPFAADTLRAERPDIAAKIRVLPYCYDEALFGVQPAPRPVASAEPVRFLMVGQITPRKGIHLLLPAFDRLPAGSATLTLVGPVGVPQAVLARYADRVTIIPTVPRSQVPAIMAAHHVLVFPSYFEGSALSLIEGLASGLALIQSRNAGNGVTPATGLLLDELSVDALAEAMLAPVRDRDRLDAWRSAAQAEAHRYRFAAYRDNIARLLAGELDGR